MADEMSPGEIRRTLERMERAHDDDVRHLADDWREASDRIERTSQERMATLRTEIAGVRGEVAGVRRAQEQHVKAHESDRSWSRSKTLTVIAIAVGAAATLIGAYIAAFAAAGGVHG